MLQQKLLEELGPHLLHFRRILLRIELVEGNRLLENLHISLDFFNLCSVIIHELDDEILVDELQASHNLLASRRLSSLWS